MYPLQRTVACLYSVDSSNHTKVATLMRKIAAYVHIFDPSVYDDVALKPREAIMDIGYP